MRQAFRRADSEQPQKVPGRAQAILPQRQIPLLYAILLSAVILIYLLLFIIIYYYLFFYYYILLFIIIIYYYLLLLFLLFLSQWMEVGQALQGYRCNARNRARQMLRDISRPESLFDRQLDLLRWKIERKHRLLSHRLLSHDPT